MHMEDTDLLDLHIALITEEAKYVIQHLRNNDSTGRRIKINMEISQLETGTGHHITRNGESTKVK